MHLCHGLGAPLYLCHGGPFDLYLSLPESLCKELVCTALQTVFLATWLPSGNLDY